MSDDIKQALKSILRPNKIVAQLYIEFARLQIAQEDIENQTDKGKRFMLLYDLYIKARAYSILNKWFFWLCLISSLAVIIWPSFSTMSESLGVSLKLTSSAIIQTTITGIAALTFTAYSHYKKRQLHTENLMRYAIFTHADLSQITDMVIKEMQRLDSGFGFSHQPSEKAEKEEDATAAKPPPSQPTNQTK